MQKKQVRKNKEKEAEKAKVGELTPPTPPLADDKFKDSDCLIVDVVNEFGEEVKAYIPQPHYLLTNQILPFLRKIYALSKNDEVVAQNPEILMADWEALKRECVPQVKDVIKNDAIFEEFKAKISKFVDEALKNARFIVKEGEARGEIGKLKDLITTSEVRLSFEIKLLFQYALMRYAYQMIQVSELRACYTALSFEEYHKSFMKYIEEMEAYLESSKEVKN